eukprot:295463_1
MSLSTKLQKRKELLIFGYLRKHIFTTKQCIPQDITNLILKLYKDFDFVHLKLSKQELQKYDCINGPEFEINGIQFQLVLRSNANAAKFKLYLEMYHQSLPINIDQFNLHCVIDAMDELMLSTKKQYELLYQRNDILLSAYDNIDIDDNGDIEWEEFKYGMDRLNVSLTEQEMKQIFALMDSDFGNFVDINEFSMFLSQIFESNELTRFQDAILCKIYKENEVKQWVCGDISQHQIEQNGINCFLSVVKIKYNNITKHSSCVWTLNEEQLEML